MELSYLEKCKTLKEDVCGNCACYMSRKYANLAAKEAGIKPAYRKRKIFYGSPYELICIHSGIHTSPALLAGCKYYKKGADVCHTL